MMEEKKFQTPYGYFTSDGREYVITRPDTPRPWVNVICPGDYGLVISQAGSGFSWRTNVKLNMLTRWEQDLIKDDWGKYLYLRDNASGDYWSLAWKPVCRKPESYQCRHGIGYTTINSLNNGISSSLTFFVPPDEPLEVWVVKLRNESSEKRSLTLFTYLEWRLGAVTDSHREFHKTFIETEYLGKESAILARKRLWEIGKRQGQEWNMSWKYVAFHSSSIKPNSFVISRESFLGKYGSLESPAILSGESSTRTPLTKQGPFKWEDPIASFQLDLQLSSYQEKTIIFTLGCAKNRKEALSLIRKYRKVENGVEVLEKTKKFWEKYLSSPLVETPDEGFNFMNNIWLKYQALSARLWGRTGYYQLSGAYGFRDQLQDSQIFLPFEPESTRKQIFLHARHQFKDGTVYHWWHPISEEGIITRKTDDLLWLPYVTINYLKETDDFSILSEKIPYLYEAQKLGKVTGEADTLYNHCKRAIERVLKRLSPRELPLIGEGDWNDGLSAVGYKWKGESIWLAHFLYGILRDFAQVAEKRGDKILARRYIQRSKVLKERINRYAWDGGWYIRATKDSGAPIGSSKCKEGKIFLNAQTWAIINSVAPEERAKKAMDSVERILGSKYGPLLFYPAYSQPDETIGYLTRYAPGVRENGGVYTHAAVWAVMAECIMKRQKKAWEYYLGICPVYRGMDSELYRAEPYVIAGNVDGPASPSFGQAGWTWYTGSAAWMWKVGIEWILGVRATFDGLIVAPCIPREWKGFKIERRFRGDTYQIEVDNSRSASYGVREVVVDGKKEERVKGTPPYAVIPIFGDGKTHKVVVKLG
jgi:cellobiose phosphorylase